MLRLNKKNVSSLVLFLLFATSCSNLSVYKLNNRANELMNKGDVDSAIARLESILDLNPKHYETYYNLGIAYYNKNDFEKSETYLEKAVKINPKFADAYYTLGVVTEEIALEQIESLDDENFDKKMQKENKDDIKLSKEEKLLKISNYYKKSLDSFSKYVELINNKKEVNDIKNKIEELKTDLENYSAQLEELKEKKSL